jgi:hypothetical protein
LIRRAQAAAAGQGLAVLALPRALAEGSEALDSKLDAIGRGSREEKTEESRGDRSRQKSPSQMEKGCVSRRASLQPDGLILRFSRRLQPKAALVPRRGRGPGTGLVTGEKVRLFAAELE